MPIGSLGDVHRTRAPRKGQIDFVHYFHVLVRVFETVEQRFGIAAIFLGETHAR